MKSFKDFINNAHDHLRFWSREGSAKTVQLMYYKQTILENGHFELQFHDVDGHQVADSVTVTGRCQYFNAKHMLDAFVAHIVDDKFNFYIMSSADVEAAEQSDIRASNGYNILTVGAKSTRLPDGSMKLEFNRPVMLPGAERRAYVTIIVKPDVLRWYVKCDVDIYNVDKFDPDWTKEFAERHNIRPTMDPNVWKTMQIRDDIAILKDL